MDKILLPENEYEAVKQEYKERNGYDEMSDEEKAAFDERLDKVLGVQEDGEDTEEGDETEAGDSTDATDTTEGNEATDRETMRQQLRERYNYDDLSDEDKETFDKSCDAVIDEYFAETEQQEETEETENTDDMGYARKLR